MRSATSENIRKIIRDKGLKQIAVAEKAGYSNGKFNNMLNGRKLITDVDVSNIANALGVEPNDLYGIGKEDDSTKK